MNTVDSGHYLLTVIKNAEDISLFMETYNACTADDILRGNVTLDGRPLIVFGSEKRHVICKKKLPLQFKEAKLEYDVDKVIYITSANLKDFVTQTLDKLKSGIDPMQEEKEETLAIETEETLKLEYQAEVSAIEEIVEESTPEEKVEEGKDPGSVTEPEEEKIQPTTQIKSGLCRYGVPIISVEYVTPNVLGLQESLFADVDKEDIKQFFNKVKESVISNITNDN